MPLRLRTGVLVIGSLDWESKDYGGAWACEQEKHRVSWRQARLREDAASVFMVDAPIRYGRLSGSRNNTYTMVISPEFNTRPGIGKVIRCRQDVDTIDDLIKEAERLWEAEDKKSDGSLISKDWGCVALVIPPNFRNHDDKAERQKLLEGWKARTTHKTEPDYGKLAFSAEDIAASKPSPIIEDGLLDIPWPRLLNCDPLPLDLLLLTATNPEIGPSGRQTAYPTARAIADMWNANGHVYYFRCNRLAGIQTADDPEIEKYLV